MVDRSLALTLRLRSCQRIHANYTRHSKANNSVRGRALIPSFQCSGPNVQRLANLNQEVPSQAPAFTHTSRLFLLIDS